MSDDKAIPADKLSSVVVRMPADLHDAVRAKAAEEDRSVAQTIRRALKQYVEPPRLFASPEEAGAVLDETIAAGNRAAEARTKEAAAEAVGQAVRVEPDAIVGALKAGAASLKGTPEKCLHPVNRRIGKGCGACGEAVK